MKDSVTRFSHTTIALHWLVALFMIALMCSGMYMAQAKVFSLYPLHKSMGAVALVFIVWRLVWRLMNGMPQPLSAQKTAADTLATVIHWVLLIGTVLFPLSGIIMSLMGGHGLYVFGMELYPNNPNPDMPGRNLPLNKDMAGFARTVHGGLGPIMLGALALHVAGALKRHFIDRDSTLKRMLGKS